MVSNSVIIKSSQLSRAGITQQTLNDGSSVRVRIIADKGNGRYTGSVAGVRVNFISEKPLSVGLNFVATISAKNGVIYVTPKNQDVNVLQQIEVTLAENSQLTGLLESLGLSSDSVYMNVLQEMKQLEMKFDTQLMYKIHNLAIQFKGKEKKASELITAFIHKGINLSKKDILQLIQYFECLEGRQNESYDEYENAKKSINELNNKNKGWFLLPFELVNIGSDDILGSGVLRLLFDSQEKLKLLNISCDYKSKLFLYSLTFENNRCKSVKYNISPFDEAIIDKKTESLREKLKKFGVTSDVEWVEPVEIEDLACETEEFFAFGGEV